VALTGRLNELTPPELFQLISLARKTGKLVLTSGDRQGVVVFRNGRVVFAASDFLRSGFCRTLAEGRIVADADLIRAVERQLPGSTTDSGSFLVEFREASAGLLEATVREQIEKTARELLGWVKGHFVFESMELPEGDDVSLNTGWFLLDSGVKPDELLLGALTKLDEDERSAWEKDLEQAAAEPAPEGYRPAPQSELSAAFQVLRDGATGEISWAPVSFGANPERDLGQLRRLMGEMNQLQGMSPTLTAEVALLILRYAAQVVNRGVLFAVREDRIQGIGQFGLRIEGESPAERVRNLWLPLGQGSVLGMVAASGEAYVGRLAPSRWSSFLVERLGGEDPHEVAVVPLVVDGKVVAMLYGDNLPRATVVGAVDGLEILMNEIGLAVEKARLERRVRGMKGRARS